MLRIQNILFAVTFGLATLTAQATPIKPELDKDYKVLQQPQQTDAAGKIEVTEFFYYSCPHCNLLDPLITEWVKKQGNAISFKRIPVDFGQGQQPLQRMYYTLEAMGQIERLHSQIFDAIHKQRQYFFRSDLEVSNFLATKGIDKDKYLEISKSFTVESKMRRAGSLMAAYKIDGVPTLFVDGRYMTSPSTLTTSYPGMPELDGAKNCLTVLDYLVAKAQKDRGLVK